MFLSHLVTYSHNMATENKRALEKPDEAGYFDQLLNTGILELIGFPEAIEHFETRERLLFNKKFHAMRNIEKYVIEQRIIRRATEDPPDNITGREMDAKIKATAEFQALREEFAREFGVWDYEDPRDVDTPSSSPAQSTQGMTPSSSSRTHQSGSSGSGSGGSGGFGGSSQRVRTPQGSSHDSNLEYSSQTPPGSPDDVGPTRSGDTSDEDD